MRKDDTFHHPCLLLKCNSKGCLSWSNSYVVFTTSSLIERLDWSLWQLILFIPCLLLLWFLKNHSSVFASFSLLNTNLFTWNWTLLNDSKQPLFSIRFVKNVFVESFFLKERWQAQLLKDCEKKCLMFLFSQSLPILDIYFYWTIFRFFPP